MITIVKQTQAVKILDKRLEDSKFTQGQENIHIKSLERGNNRRNPVPRTLYLKQLKTEVYACHCY